MKSYNLFKSTVIFISLCLISTFSLMSQDAPRLKYEVNLNDRTEDTFKVELNIEYLTKENNIFQFASTAPGTYQVHDIGRFVNDFKAFDKKGKEIKTERISTNQFLLTNPKKINQIKYTVSDIWDTKVDSNRVYRMCTTSIENDHVLINGQAVFGYVKGMQSSSIGVKLEYPNDWSVGTALRITDDGYYLASSFDHLVDSPILLGRLTKASTNIDGTVVDIYTYSKTDKIKSEQILISMEEMLDAANSFIDGLPVDRYTFLFHFEDLSEGAWEHSYSSTYILQEGDWEKMAKSVKDIAAHEFFHIVTPLNIHSEIIEVFNFERPVTSDHLWLYEGTTEWAANMMLFRTRQISIEEYLNVLHTKAELSEKYYDNSVSLVQLAKTSFTEEGQKNYGNIYQKGALVAELLNIRLLELSKGAYGLREVIIELANKYGSENSFDDNSFFMEFSKMTFPEIEDFFEKYVIHSEELPFESYFNKIGINYIAKQVSNSKSKFPFNLKVREGKLVLLNVTTEGKVNGIQNGDLLFSIDNEEINMQNIHGIFSGYQDKKKGEAVQLVVIRNGEQIHIETSMIQKEDNHIFEVNPDASKDQMKLRETWMKQLN